MLGCIDGAQGGGITLVLGFTPQYLRLKYMPIKACIMENIDKGYLGRNILIVFR